MAWEYSSGTAEWWILQEQPLPLWPDILWGTRRTHLQLFEISKRKRSLQSLYGTTPITPASKSNRRKANGALSWKEETLFRAHIALKQVSQQTKLKK